MPRESALANTFVELADTLVADFDVVDLLTLLTDRCVEVLDVAAAGILLQAVDGDLHVLASSSPVLRGLELFEVQSQEGPCLDCFRTGVAVTSVRLSEDNARWPQFAAQAVEAGFYSVHALPMRLRGTVVGALNLFDSDAEPMAEDDVMIAQAFADVATIAVLQHRASSEGQVLNTQLQNALNSRILIEQAKGMIAERASLNMEEAFVALRSYARNRNLRLADVAVAIIEGDLAAAEVNAP